ncbi:MAG TPA: hypothetical protein DEP60_08560 [Ruminococcaceae bacterium]|jgi:hypothetical protein|nr:hypothetical protein [Oscillospiraceae bacterium]HCC02740.1 hypothetical protein [Oscillospiraceae bacterium]
MPASQKTTHGLNLWTAEDHPLRQDFVSDNQTIDDVFSAHVADTSLHKTPEDQTPMVTGTYCGDGQADRTIALGFNPRAVQVFACGSQLLQVDGSGNLALYMGITATGLSGSALKLQNDQGFHVGNDTANSYVYSLLNQSGKNYGYIAFR